MTAVSEEEESPFKPVDPSILAQVTAPPLRPRDTQAEVETGGPEAEAASAPVQLTGAPKQITWAHSIREATLALNMPPKTRALFNSIHASTWWIANRQSLPFLVCKEPSADQRTLSAETAAQMHLAEETEDARAVLRPAAIGLRVSDAEAWARSVSRTPQLAEAAILAVLYKLYTEPGMKRALHSRACQLLSEGVVALEKDEAAIRKLLGS